MSSVCSIFSPEGMAWIGSKADGAERLTALLCRIRQDSPGKYWRPDLYHDLFASHVYKPLPTRPEVFSLLKDYFKTVNCMLPLYHEQSFMQLVELQYTQQTCDDDARWASINVMVALAYAYRTPNSTKPEKYRERAWLYFKNAMSVSTELVLRRTDLLSVQALLGMVWPAVLPQ